jgi:hypothetical protein
MIISWISCNYDPGFVRVWGAADDAVLKKNFSLLTLATVEKEGCQQQATKADSGRFNLNSAPSDLEFIFHQKRSHLQESSLTPPLS